MNVKAWLMDKADDKFYLKGWVIAAMVVSAFITGAVLF